MDDGTCRFPKGCVISTKRGVYMCLVGCKLHYYNHIICMQRYVQIYMCAVHIQLNMSSFLGGLQKVNGWIPSFPSGTNDLHSFAQLLTQVTFNKLGSDATDLKLPRGNASHSTSLGMKGPRP